MRVRDLLLAGSRGVEVGSRSFTMGRADLRAPAELHLQWSSRREASCGGGRLCPTWRTLWLHL
jgi:hypothetical protein